MWRVDRSVQGSTNVRPARTDVIFLAVQLVTHSITTVFGAVCVMDKSEKRLLLVIIAFLCGAIAGLVAGGLLSQGDPRDAVLCGFGAFAGTTLFVLKIESVLGLFPKE